jgi:hypothetical protein
VVEQVILACDPRKHFAHRSRVRGLPFDISRSLSARLHQVELYDTNYFEEFQFDVLVVETTTDAIGCR